MRNLELADNLREFKNILATIENLPFGAERDNLIKDYISRYLDELKYNPESEKELKYLAWLYYPGFFLIKNIEHGYNEVFNIKIDIKKYEKFIKIIPMEGTKMEPLLTFYYVHLSETPPDSKIIEKIKDYHKSNGNPAYLFWHLYEKDIECFDKECTYYLSTLSLFYGPENENQRIMKELFFSEPDIILTYYPYLAFSLTGDSLDKDYLEDNPYDMLFQIKGWLVARKIENKNVFEFLNILLNHFLIEKDYQAIMDTYRLYLIFALNLFGFSNKTINEKLSEIQDRVCEILDQVTQIEREFFLMEQSVVNILGGEDPNYEVLYRKINEYVNAKHQKIVLMGVSQLLRVSKHLREHFYRWCDLLKSKGAYEWISEIIDTQEEFMEIFLETKDIDDLVWDYIDGPQPIIPMTPEVKIILASETGELIWLNNSTKLKQNDVKILRAIRYNEKSADELCSELGLGKSALKKAIQRLRERLKSSPINIKFDDKKYFLVCNPEWEVKFVDKESISKI